MSYDREKPQSNFAMEAINLDVYTDASVDRSRELHLLEQNIMSGKNTAVVGPNFSGKSSICFTVLERNKEKYPYIRRWLGEDIEPEGFVTDIESAIKRAGLKEYPRVVCLEEMTHLNNASDQTPIIQYIKAHPDTTFIMVCHNKPNPHLATSFPETIEVEFINEVLRPKARPRKLK